MRAAVDLFGAGQIAVHVEGGGIPRRIARDEVAEVAGSNTELWRRVGDPKGLAGRAGSRHLDVSGLTDDSGIDAFGCCDFLHAQAPLGLTASALRDCGIEIAFRRIRDDAI